MPLKGFCLYFALLGLMQTTTSVVVMICQGKLRAAGAKMYNLIFDKSTVLLTSREIVHIMI